MRQLLSECIPLGGLVAGRLGPVTGVAAGAIAVDDLEQAIAIGWTNLELPGGIPLERTANRADEHHSREGRDLRERVTAALTDSRRGS